MEHFTIIQYIESTDTESTSQNTAILEWSGNAMLL